MTLPEDLQQAIEAFTSSSSLSVIAQATQELTLRYRDPQNRQQGHLVATEAQRHAYLTARMPATFGVVEAALQELLLRVPEINLQSLLDVGAGPGTAMWAVFETFPSLQRVSLIEQNFPFIEVGKKLSQSSSHLAIQNAKWAQEDMTKASSWSLHDLVVLSYSIGEINEQLTSTVIQKSWDATQKILVVIEPGTPKGYQKILKVREQLIGLGAHLVAPCPHAMRCPKQGSEDWCHFSCRLSRSGQHRKAKSAQLGYEDEKYCYLIFSRDEVLPVKERILRDPLKKSGHLYLELCTVDGIEKRIVSKRDPEAYQWAKKADWGDGR